MRYLQFALWGAGLSLQILVLSALLRGAYRKFPTVFVYSVVLLLTTVVDIAAALDAGFINKASLNYYWTDELLRQTAIGAVVIELVYKALRDDPRRASKLRLMIFAAILYIAFSLYFTRNENFTAWMNPFVRNIILAAGVVNLALWTKLITRRDRDHSVLLISSGLGIQVAGETIGRTLLQMTPMMKLVGSLIAVMASFACSVIWWRALRLKNPGHQAAALSVSRR